MGEPLASDESANTPRRRRRLTYPDQVATVSLPTDPKSDRKPRVKNAAQAWAESNKVILGTWSSVRWCADNRYRLTARCNKCQKCSEAEGTVFQFTGHFQGVEETILELSIAKDGVCSGEPRTLRSRAVRDEEGEVTAEGRQAVQEAVDHLLENGLSASAGSVKMKLASQSGVAGQKISAVRIRNMLRSMKFSHGRATRRFSESIRDLKSYVDTLDGSMLSMPVLQFEPFFAYVAILEPFMNSISALQPERISLCADFTFNFTHMGYEYGLVCASLAIPANLVVELVFTGSIFFHPSV